MVVITNARPAAIQLDDVAPVFRISDADRAKRFYCDWLGFTVDWIDGHGGSVHIQVSRGNAFVHLTTSDEFAIYGGTGLIRMTGLTKFIRRLGRHHELNELDVIATSRGRMLRITDPFGNHLHFLELD